MPYESNWLPGRRENQLAMVADWLLIIGNSNPPPWGIPSAEVSDLSNLNGEATNALILAQSSNRTPAITAECKAAFDALIAKMRFIKSRYFLTPPLTDADLVSLELKPKDTAKTAGSPAHGPSVWR